MSQREATLSGSAEVGERRIRDFNRKIKADIIFNFTTRRTQ
ncbi:MAG: hypothetical protein SPJ16_03990 [Helicobacter sp.]|nr:hypothetical protein [Helicobacter sp.]MDY5950336.1 hypothetical protein [Helicobacter sp.]